MSSEEVQNKIQELESLKKVTGFWKLGGTCAILLIALICVYLIYRGVKTLAEEGPAQKEFVAELKEGFDSQIKPQLETKGKEAKDKAIKILQAEADKLKERIPEFTEKAQAELMVLVEELQSEGNKVFEATFGKVMKQREAKIRRMYPDVTDASISNALNNLQTALDAELSELTESLFMNHLVAMDGILQQLEKIQIGDEVDMLYKDVPWEVATLVFDIVREEFDDSVNPK